VSDGYLFNDALTNALATQRRMRNGVIIMAVKSVKGCVHYDHYYCPVHRQYSHLLTHFTFLQPMKSNGHYMYCLLQHFKTLYSAQSESACSVWFSQ
jgi:hypothetical protein